MPVRSLRALVPLAGVYGAYFAATGVTLPFLPGYLQEEGLSPTEIGLLLAIQPAFGMFAPAFFCSWADRRSAHNRSLILACVGAALGFSTLLLADGFATYALAMAAYALFVTSIVPLIDSLTLEAVREAGASYSHLRIFGSFGFVVASLSVGFFVPKLDRVVLLVPLLLMIGAAVFATFIRTRIARPTIPDAISPRLSAGLFYLLAASALHWIACAPFHGSLALYVRALELPTWVVGGAAGLGVAAEIVVMTAYPRTLQRLSERAVLGLAFAGSALRWLGMSVATSALAIVGLSLLHGLTFGAFYIAALSFLARTIPPERRARGQGLFGAVTFGAGGLIGYAVSGVGFDALGGPGLFAVAAGAEVVAALIVLRIPTLEMGRA
ncbi:MAG: MFS transporter [Polyangiaceae bacterium]|nr:MFS transporter [Polyangiaceae bacterium]